MISSGSSSKASTASSIGPCVAGASSSPSAIPSIAGAIVTPAR
jgi:hypothetical protein